MATRRAPLANVPNGTNSPHRAPGLKRPRPATTQLETNYVQPPLKKQLLDRDGVDSRSVARKPVYSGNDGKVFTRKNATSQPTPFERKLVAVREKERQNPPRGGSKYDKPSGEEHIRQWQRHYRKVFPQFVFYFESIAEDFRYKCSKQVRALGASEEKFFSKAVTHVVTARPIPPEVVSPSSAEASTPSVATATPDGSLQTVNPSLLEKQRNVRETDSRREHMNPDVLYRAREMHMKIWSLEKLQRILATINDGNSTAQGQHVRGNGVSAGPGKKNAETDLSHVLRKEQLNGPSDVNMFSWGWGELIHFKGPYIYVHDMDEKTKPVLVREYPKVAKKQDGAWPQFRSAPLGKCPFIDEPKKSQDKQKAANDGNENEKKPAAKTAAPAKTTAMKPPQRAAKNEKQGDHEPTNHPAEAMPAPKLLDAPTALPAKPPSPRNATAAQRSALAMYLGREPAASGVQPSNITSAIRSQMISSTAAAPGAKAGTSKEVHELKRKVLERSTGSLALNGMSSSHRPTDTATGSMQAPPNDSLTRGAKGKGQGKLDRIEEADTSKHGDEKPRGNQTSRGKNNAAAAAARKLKEKKRDPKPGYCENCRDKFDDFDEHVLTRQHRKFAMTAANWEELDDLLETLERPHKGDDA